MHKKTAFNIGMMTFCNISVRILGMLYKLYLASAVSPVALGIYQLVMPLYFVFSAPIASGLPLAASRLTAQTGRREAVLSSALRVALLPLCLCTLIMLSACGIIASLFLHDKSKYMLVLALIPAVVLGSVADIFAGSMHGTGKSYYPAICSCIEQILKIAFALAAVSLFGDFTESDAIFPVLALSFGGIVSFILMYTRSGKVSLKKSGYERDVFLTAYPPTLSRLFTSLLHLCTTSILPLRLISNGFTRAAALAQYGILTSMFFRQNITAIT